MNDEWMRTIDCPRHDLSVTVEIGAEHHMGAAPVSIRLSRPLGGVQEFVSTNGDALFVDSPPLLVVHDACVIVAIELPNGPAYHLLPPYGWYFANARIEGERLLSELYNDRNRRPIASIPLTELTAHFQPGFGPVVRGRFPSAHP
jgi:hypothetical protein